MNKHGDFLRRTFQRHLGPAMLSMFGVMASTMVSSLITGNVLGAQGLAAMSVVTPIYFIFATLGSLVGVGGSTLASHAIGQDRQEDANAALTLSIALTAGLGVLLSALGLLFLNPLLSLLGATEELFPMARAYALVYVSGGVGTAMFYLPYNFLKLMGRLGRLTGLFFGMAVLNGALDLLFLFPMGMGIEGVALGTVLSSLAVAAAGTACLVRGEDAFHLTGLKGRGGDILRLSRFGSPAALNNLATVARSMFLNRIVLAVGGNMGLAAFSLVSTTANLSLTLLSGLSQAAAPFVGVFTAERDHTSVRDLMGLSFRVGMPLILGFAGLTALLAQPLCRLFGVPTGETLAAAVDAVRLFSLSLPPAMAGYLLISYYQSAGYTRLANLMTACRAFAFVVGPAWLLAPRLGLSGVWLSFTAGECAALVLLFATLPAYRERGRRSPVLLLDRRVEESGRYISFAVKAESAAIVESAEKIADFCEQNELSPKRAMLVSLSLEEMMVSIRDHCFSHSPEAAMDVRILVVPDEARGESLVVLRIRSGGPRFNPIAYYERRRTENPEEMGEFLGVAMIIKAAQMVDYKSTFGVNNLTVTL